METGPSAGAPMLVFGTADRPAASGQTRVFVFFSPKRVKGKDSVAWLGDFTQICPESFLSAAHGHTNPILGIHSKTVSIQALEHTPPADYHGYRTIRYNLKVVFSCLTAIPFVVFAFIYFRIGAFTTALSGFLLALVLIIVLEGFIIFRRMAEHVELLSSTMTKALEGKGEKIQNGGSTREFAIIADTFNRTLFKLEDAAEELGVRAAQAAALNEIRELVSSSINMEEIARAILSRAVKAVNAQAGYLAVKKDTSSVLHVAASVGISGKFPDRIELDSNRTFAGLALQNKSPISIEDIEEEPHKKDLNSPDMGLPRLLYLSIVAKGAAIGVLALGRTQAEAPFQEEYIQFLQTLLQQVAYSIENARLYENLRLSNAELESALETQKKAQEQMLASARMAVFGELSLNIAHELNNPLTGILGYTDLILNTAEDGSQLQDMMQRIRSQAVRASNITRNLLDFVSIEAGSRVKTDLNELVKKVFLLARGRLRDSGIQLEVKLADRSLPIMAEPAQILQVFFNLLSNALNAMTGAFEISLGAEENGLDEENPRLLLRVETGVKDEEGYVSFKDTGTGISPKHLPRIFEPFYSTQDKVSEVGLGLWVSHRIIKAHGGVIRVRSTPDKGSTFVVFLPLAGNSVS
jgi:signal transduction histidine kinase